MNQKKKPSVSYHRKPVDLTTTQWQMELRREFAGVQPFTITRLGGEHPIFADYAVKNPASGGDYKVALRSNGVGLNFCTCMDFKTNALGTCKHIEAVLHTIENDPRLARLLTQRFTPQYSSIFLRYGKTREVMLRLGTEHKARMEHLAKDYFDSDLRLKPHAFDTVDRFITQAAAISPEFRIYADATEFIIARREEMKRRNRVDQLFSEGVKSTRFDALVKTSLYPYQRESVLFAVRAGRCLIADDMGLGKTIQALATAELLKQEFGIRTVLIICPTSLKYQWKSEIETFTGNTAMVIEGSPTTRKDAYQQNMLYKIISYNVVGADQDAIQILEPDLVILDEAQRIKNWKTRTAQEVKKIRSPYAIVLTGTPIENKLEELYSIIQFIDPFRLGPLYRFLEEHQIKDDQGKVVGYNRLHQISTILSDVVLRRTKKEVLTQLPERVDKQLFVPLTKEQADIHEEYADMVARLVSKWKRLGFLDEKDRQRLLSGLNCMRMVCDSTYILDQKTRFDTKITELMSILDDVLQGDGEKAVVFSQWERMTRLVAAELDARNVGYEYLHGGIPSAKRKDLISNFHHLADRRVFLSTDAGGVGLNLQCASFLVNCDIPWNPAVLEQRIGRIHRLGQKRAVQIVNLVSRDSIEHRMLDVLKFKTALFAGVLDMGEDQIFMGEDRFKQFMKSVEQMTDGGMTPVRHDVEEEQEEEAATAHDKQSTDDLFVKAGELFGALAQRLSDKESATQLISSFVEKDPASGKQFVRIPIENQEVIAKTVDAIGGLLKLLGQKQR